MKTSARGTKLIKDSEGLRLTAYDDGGGVWTIGWGHTGKWIKPGFTITLEEAEALLQDDLAIAEQGVTKAVAVPLNQNQLDALISFVFNLGIGALRSSTLLRLLNLALYTEASDQFLRWVHGADGAVLPGLTRRREAERSLFTFVHL